MGRPKRIQFAGACYYIVLQGNNRQDIFLSNQDRRSFLSMLRAYKDRYKLKVYAYCLMSNSVSLLLETSQPNLSIVMQGFNTGYTKYFNSGHHSMGHVFRGAIRPCWWIRALPGRADALHPSLQPARSGLKEKPWRYQWSSCTAYVESDASEPLVDSEVVLARFGKIRLKQSVRYLQYVKDRMRSASEFILPVVGERPSAARRSWRAATPRRRRRGRGGRRRPTRARGSSPRSRPSMIAEKLFGRLQWRRSPPCAAGHLPDLEGSPPGVTEIGRLFGRTPSAISQLIKAKEQAAGR